jgi:hypothetical protein
LSYITHFQWREISLTSAIDQFIQDVVREKQPDTVEQLAHLVQEKFMIPHEEAMKHIISLNVNGKLNFKEQSLPVTRRPYLFSLKAMWYWIIMVLNVAAVASAFVIPENAFPMVYVRYLFGSIFAFFLPGFCLIKALFPQKELEQIERATLSVGISLSIVALISFLLNYTYWGITIATLTMSLVTLTVTFATVAVLRERRVRVK